MQRKLHALLLAFTVFFLASCSKDDDNTVASKGAYDNGYFIVNEGNFQVKAGDLSFHNYNADTLSQDNYIAVNTGSPLATTTTTLEYGTIYNGKLYLVTNFGGPLVAADEYSLKESARNSSLPANGHAFIGIDNTSGLLSTDKGIYPVTLSSLALGTKISGVTGSVGDMLKSGNYVFALSDNGILALKAGDYSVAKNLGTAIAGFAQGKDGYVYAAQTNALLKIDPATLKVDTITTTFNVRYNQYVFNSSSIVASTQENAVYVLGDDQKVYRYVSGNNSSLGSAYITLPANHYFYGKGIGYDGAKNSLVLITNASVWGNDANNTLYTYSAADASLKNTLNYTGFLYPAMVVFH
ncbi:DUF5074 domain-containing protein [Chitinophaga sancti]|uniref:DUF5074 domain-containing protein n=1 Tax=Chitinophaga sancti TaxID=1004 RepID=UPI003F7B0537